MGARGFNVAQEGHTVLVLAPGNISGGATGQIFSMKTAAKCCLTIAYGALSAAPGAVQIFACSDLAGDNAQAIGFDRFQQVAAGAGADVLAPRVSVLPAGFIPSDVPNTVDVLHFQADQLPMGFPYVKLVIADGTDTDYVTAIATLSGVRYQGESNQSATV